MNLLFESIVFLFIASSVVPSHVAESAVSQTIGPARIGLPAKKAARRKSGPASSAEIPVQFIWQIISSQGLGSRMNTLSETFASDGRLVPVGADQWKAVVGSQESLVRVKAPQDDKDGFILIDKHDVLQLLNIDLPARPNQLNGERTNDLESLSGTVQLIVGKSPNRSFESIYRSPDEDLFLVKVAVIVGH